jgi:ribonucleoside-diphosphate reductase beta chain
MTNYDISFNPEYQKRKLWLDGEVSVQRFDSVKYPKLDKYEEIARGYYWTPEEISLMKDKEDFKKANKAERHMYTSNLLRQTTLDSMQSPYEVFGPCVSLPEVKNLLLNWTFFESNIHSRAYSHIIRNVYSNPSEIFDNIHKVQPIVDMAASIGKYYNYVVKHNIAMQYGHEDYDELAHKKAILLALHASYGLEAIRFIVSFATSLGMMENGMFIGNGAEISLILQDELLHTEWTADLLKLTKESDPDFKNLEEQHKDEIYQIYADIIQEEKEWADYLFSEGVVVGLNARILSQFVDWTAKEKLQKVGIKYLGTAPRSHPIPWYLKHSEVDNKQTALQETESTSYVIGAMTDTIHLKDLPDL